MRSPRWLPGAPSAVMLPVTDRASLLEIGLGATKGGQHAGKSGGAADVQSPRSSRKHTGGGGKKQKSPQGYLQEGRKLIATWDYRAAVKVHVAQLVLPQVLVGMLLSLSLLSMLSCAAQRYC